MAKILFEIEGREENIGSVWVHLQNAPTHATAMYKIAVPNSLLDQVFAHDNTEHLKKTWVECISEAIEEFGTFIVEGYIENIRTVLNEGSTGYRWVIASVDSIRETENGIELAGQAIPFKQ
jgi:hypothetical protein